MKKDYLGNQQSQMPKYLGLIVLIFFVFALGWNTGLNHSTRLDDNSSSDLINRGARKSVDMQLYWDTWDLLNTKYVDPSLLDYQEMVYGAIRGMVASTGDPYTAFMTPKENKEFQDSLNGDLEGIGAELTLRNGLLTVVSPLKNSPAQKAGLRPEDIIYQIDGEIAEDYTLEQAVMLIRGPKGSRVTLTVLREGADEPIDIIIRRAKINIESVELSFDGDIAILELNQFGTNTMDEFNIAVNDILTSGAEGLVLDMRYNGGGFLDGAIDIVSEFVQAGHVVTVKQRNPQDNEVIFVNGKARMQNIPIVAIINRGSASASEIVAGALQDHNRAIVVGETSFGKGTVQEVVNLVGGASLRVTIAKWFTPDNRDIDQIGVEPDVYVERTPEDFETDNDPQLEKALEILRQ